MKVTKLFFFLQEGVDLFLLELLNRLYIVCHHRILCFLWNFIQIFKKN
ncbi:hypothetical protein [Helicobacter rodentium]|nr:hypothetical protein [Helicobacter rodentium]